MEVLCNNAALTYFIPIKDYPVKRWHRFFAVNMPLVYDALSTTNVEEAYIRMSVMIFCQLTVGFYWSVILDICVPSLYQRLMLYHMRMNVAKTNKKISIKRCKR